MSELLANKKGWMAMLALLSLLGCKKHVGQPKLVFSTESVEIGLVYKDTTYADFSVEFRNDGSQRLNVYRVIPECSCTEILSVDSFVEPRKTGFIKGRLKTQEVPPGDFSEELVVFSDGSTEPLHYFINGEMNYSRNK